MRVSPRERDSEKVEGQGRSPTAAAIRPMRSVIYSHQLRSDLYLSLWQTHTYTRANPRSDT